MSDDRRVEDLRAEVQRSSDPRDRLIVALDVPVPEQALRLAEHLGDRCRWVKIGMELFYAGGEAIVARLRDQGHRVFLDLKLHDIPNTVAAAVRSLSRLPIDLLTLHGFGGSAMLKAAMASAQALPQSPVLVAVTILTSMDAGQLQEVGMAESADLQVLRLARLARSCGFQALVCSPLEVSSLRRELGPDVLLIVPGVRQPGDAVNDQSRTATPRAAMESGASLLVVGRPITQAADPLGALEDVLAAISKGMELRNGS